MAVDSLRETRHINRIRAADLTSLWTAQSYRPEITRALAEVRGRGNWLPLGQMCSQPIAQGRTPTYAEGRSGYPCLKTKHVNGLIVDESEPDFVTVECALELGRFKVAEATVLMNRSGAGSVGRCSVYLGTSAPLTNEHVLHIRLSPPNDPCFVAAYLSTWWGERAIEQGVTGSTGQLNLANEHVARVPVPALAAEAQRYVGNKVRQAEMLRNRARRLDELTAAVFSTLVASLPPPSRAWRVPARDAEAYRLNPSHFDPVVRAAIQMAQQQTRVRALSELVPDGDIAGGATPLGAQYAAEGIFFARVQNVKPLRLDRSDAAFITPAQDTEITRSRCREGDVVLSITGYPGTASVVMDDDLPLNINQHSVRFAVDSNYGAGFVAAAINSRFGQLQVMRFAVGGTRDALDYTSVRSLLIPEFTQEVRSQVNRQVADANRCVRAAQRLASAAKQILERLIEGLVSESALAAAQKALESGDRSGDRAVMGALHQDVSERAAPLFPDLDALYELLDEDTEEGRS
jgi:type I restriction enzyme, S subunit